MQTNNDFQSLLVGFLVILDDLSIPGRIHTDGFFHEHMLAGLDRGGVLLRPKGGWRS